MPLAKLLSEGEVEFKAGNTKAGLSALKEAVAMEEKIVYAEPAPWMMPARHAYGALLIANGQFKEAEAVYLRDLEVLPANGWALLGLRDALRGQGRKEEAKLADEAFRRAWRSADVMPPASCYCGTGLRLRFIQNPARRIVALAYGPMGSSIRLLHPKGSFAVSESCSSSSVLPTHRLGDQQPICINGLLEDWKV